MAVAHIIFGNALDLSKGGSLPTLYVDADMVSETFTSFATHQETAIVAPKLGSNPVCVIACDTAIYVAIGVTPNATVATSRLYMPAGSVFGVTCKAGDKASVVAA